MNDIFKKQKNKPRVANVFFFLTIIPPPPSWLHYYTRHLAFTTSIIFVYSFFFLHLLYGSTTGLNLSSCFTHLYKFRDTVCPGRWSAPIGLVSQAPYDVPHTHLWVWKQGHFQTYIYLINNLIFSQTFDIFWVKSNYVSIDSMLIYYSHA